MDIRVETDQFLGAHGRLPRGNGWWWFNLGQCGSWTEFQWNGTYAEAKRQALRQARELGCDRVVVAS